MYACIDLKSFFASVEAVERGLNPLTDHLVVADSQRGTAALCLAITPAMKNLGIKNRCRLFQIPKHIDYVLAQPRLNLYREYSVKIYELYLKYFSKDDIHIYSIDEVFIDLSPYLALYKQSAYELSLNLISEIKENFGITAACGIGSNIYLSKVALDICAKHSSNNIAFLDKNLYIEKLHKHRPLTDFWGIGRASANKLANIGIFSMEDIAKADDKLLERLLGIHAKVLKENSLAINNTTIAELNGHVAKNRSCSRSHIFYRELNYNESLEVLKALSSSLSSSLIKKSMICDSLSLYVGYAGEYNCAELDSASIRLSFKSNSPKVLRDAFIKLYDKLVDKQSMIRKLGLSCNNLQTQDYQQLGLF